MWWLPSCRATSRRAIPTGKKSETHWERSIARSPTAKKTFWTSPWRSKTSRTPGWRTGKQSHNCRTPKMWSRIWSSSRKVYRIFTKITSRCWRCRKDSSNAWRNRVGIPCGTRLTFLDRRAMRFWMNRWIWSIRNRRVTRGESPHRAAIKLSRWYLPRRAVQTDPFQSICCSCSGPLPSTNPAHSTQNYSPSIPPSKTRCTRASKTAPFSSISRFRPENKWRRECEKDWFSSLRRNSTQGLCRFATMSR